MIPSQGHSLSGICTFPPVCVGFLPHPKAVHGNCTGVPTLPQSQCMWWVGVALRWKGVLSWWVSALCRELLGEAQASCVPELDKQVGKVLLLKVGSFQEPIDDDK